MDALRPGPGTARTWLREELSRHDYQPSLSERFWNWVHDLLNQAREVSTLGAGLSPLVALLLLAVLLVVVALALSRLRGNAPLRTSGGAVFGETRLSASHHRELARQALAGAHWDRAVVESMRAIAAGLLERGLLGEDPGATAHEITTRAAQVFPGLRTRLDRAALVFDETRYGDRPANERAARDLSVLDEEISAATPHAEDRAGPVDAVPR